MRGEFLDFGALDEASLLSVKVVRLKEVGRVQGLERMLK